MAGFNSSLTPLIYISKSGGIYRPFPLKGREFAIITLKLVPLEPGPFNFKQNGKQNKAAKKNPAPHEEAGF